MANSVQAGLMQATEIARQSDLRQSSNGVRYTAFGENNLESADLARIVQAVPASIAAALGRKAYYFVPLALMERVEEGDVAAEIAGSVGEDTMIATTYTSELSDRAICHRNVRLTGPLGGANGVSNGASAFDGASPDAANSDAVNPDSMIDGVFISTRLLADRFALAFEFFINVGHAFVDIAGIPAAFSDVVWKQALTDVRGETSLDAWESRNLALTRDEGTIQVDEKARLDFAESAFSDAVAMYLLSLAIDFDYAELRERDYPLLAPQALAERLRTVAKLFPPNAGYDFAIRYRRRK